MISVKACCVAEDVVTDGESGRVSIFNVLEGVRAESYPLHLGKVAFLTLWERAPSDPQQAGVRFALTINGEEIAGHDLEIQFQGRLQTRYLLRLNNVIVMGPGRVVFRLELPEGAYAAWVIEAEQTTEVRAPETPGPRGAGLVYESAPVAIMAGKVNVRRL